MINRCQCSSHKQFKDYGGKGIIVCSEWKQSFENFYSWALQNGYTDEKILDREKNELGYFPKNCRWVTRTESSQNKRKYRTRFQTSQYKGVFWRKDINKWQAAITHNKKKIHLGYFEEEKSAAKAYDKAASDLFGKYAVLNNP